MIGKSYKPRRHLRHELYSLMAVMCAPVAVLALFPYQAIGWKPADVMTGARSKCAFVKLSPSEAAKAVAGARSAMMTQPGASGALFLRADLSMPEMDEMTLSVSGVEVRSGAPAPAHIAYRDVPLPKSLAALKPATFPASKDDDAAVAKKTFSRDELLKINLPQIEMKGPTL